MNVGAQIRPASDRTAPAVRRPRQRLRDAAVRLFPDAAAIPAIRRGLALGALALVVGTAVSLLRTGGTGALRTVFEEDAGSVLTDAFNTSSVTVVLSPISGYYVIGPRLLGELATVFPISWAAAVLSLSSAVIAALLAIQIYVASRAHLANPFARFLVAAPLLVAPAVENRLAEVYNRPVCLHFFAM